MPHYEPKVRLKSSFFRTLYARLIAYRNAAWMLESLAETVEEKQDIKNLPVAPNLYESELYQRLVQRVQTFFYGTLMDPYDRYDPDDPDVQEFSFYTFHCGYDGDVFYESDYLAILYRLLTGGEDHQGWIMQTGIEYGFPLPDTIPPDLYSVGYVEERLAALRLEPSIKQGLLSLFHAINFISDNPFVCLWEDSPVFPFYWGDPHFSIHEFEQLKRAWQEAQPIVNSCAGLFEIFHEDEIQSKKILSALWRSLFIPTNPVSKNQLALPFDPPLWDDPVDHVSAESVTPL
jgi:hypothetical protein